MNKIRILLALGLLAFASGIWPAPTEIVVAYIDKANPPFVMDPAATGGSRPGITLELLAQLERRLPIRFRYESMPWARCLRLLHANEVDAVFHSSFNPARMETGVYPLREGLIDHSRRLITQTYYVYKRKDSPLQWDGNRFTDLRGAIGTIIDFSINADLKKAGLEAEQAPTIQTNLRKLKNGRLAAVINYDSQTDAAIKQQPAEFSDIVKLPLAFKTKFKHLMFSHRFYRNNRDLVEAVWDELKRMRESGVYAAIAEKYGGQ